MLIVVVSIESVMVVTAGWLLSGTSFSKLPPVAVVMGVPKGAH